MTISSNWSPNKEKLPTSLSEKTKHREKSRRDISGNDSDDNSDATYYPPRSSRSRRIVRSEITRSSHRPFGSTRSRRLRRNRHISRVQKATLLWPITF